MMRYETCIQHQAKRKGKQRRKFSKHVVQIHEKKPNTALGGGRTSATPLAVSKYCKHDVLFISIEAFLLHLTGCIPEQHHYYFPQTAGALKPQMKNRFSFFYSRHIFCIFNVIFNFYNSFIHSFI